MITRRCFLQTSAALGAAGCLGSLCPPVFAAAKPLSDRTAEYAVKLDDGRWQCQLCPNGCVRGEGEDGHCRARGTRNGQYRSLVYGLPCVMAVDPLGKCPLFHFHVQGQGMSIATAGCNLNCQYCQNWQFSQNGPTDTENFTLPPEEVIRKAMDYQIGAICFFYTDPVIYIEYMKEIAKLARQAKLATVMVSAAFINEKPLADLFPLIDAFVIGWKGFTEEYYAKVIGGRMPPVQAALKAIKSAGKHLEVVSLLVPTLNDQPQPLEAGVKWFADNLGPDVPWHFSRFYPQYRLKNLPTTPTQVLENARKLAMGAGIRYVYTGNIPGHEGNHTWCHQCKTVLVERLGFQILKSALRSGKCPKCGTAVPGVWRDDLVDPAMTGGRE